MEKFDLIVIGAGPGGYTSAIRAAQLGLKVAIVEREYLGGTCLNWGCIPTKSIVAVAELYHKIGLAKKLGISIENASYSWPAILKRKNKSVKKLRQGIKLLLKSNHVTVLAGKGKIIEANTVSVIDTEEKESLFATDKIIIASGSEAAQPNFLPFESPRVIDSKDFLDIPELPKSIIIVGGGVVGCEIASILNALEVDVTIVEMLERLLPIEDPEISATLSQTFKKNGIKVFTGCGISDVVASELCVSGIVGTEELEAEMMLVAIGRTLNTAKISDIELEFEGVGIKVNQHLQTSIDNIYAIGDITNKVLLAHVAAKQGIIAAEHAAGKEVSMQYNVIPSCIFCIPEIASVGLTEAQACAKGMDVLVAKFPYAALGKAIAIEETVGFFKVIAEAKTDKIIGVHIVGAHATDIISEAALAIQMGCSASDISQTIHAHPTLAEGLLEAVHALHGQCINLPAIT